MEMDTALKSDFLESEAMKAPSSCQCLADMLHDLIAGPRDTPGGVMQLLDNSMLTSTMLL